jgi:hypothetical protein
MWGCTAAIRRRRGTRPRADLQSKVGGRESGEKLGVKRRDIEERLATIEKNLANADAYIEKGVNVRSSSWLHLEDWKGRSGHPLWMKNHMVPRTKKAQAKLEAALERVADRERDRKSRKRRSKQPLRT